jgi:hypothetical protein
MKFPVSHCHGIVAHVAHPVQNRLPERVYSHISRFDRIARIQKQVGRTAQRSDRLPKTRLACVSKTVVEIVRMQDMQGCGKGRIVSGGSHGSIIADRKTVGIV